MRKSQRHARRHKMLRMWGSREIRGEVGMQKSKGRRDQEHKGARDYVGEKRAVYAQSIDHSKELYRTWARVRDSSRRERETLAGPPKLPTSAEIHSAHALTRKPRNLL